MTTTERRRTRLGLERLDDRLVPTTLTVTGQYPGSGYNDVIDIRRANKDYIDVTRNGVWERKFMPEGQSHTIAVDAGEGVNTITVGPTGTNDSVQITNSSPYWNVDRVKVGEGSLADVRGNVYVGSKWWTEVELNDSANPSSTSYVLDPTGSFTVNGQRRVWFSGVDRVRLAGTGNRPAGQTVFYDLNGVAGVHAVTVDLGVVPSNVVRVRGPYSYLDINGAGASDFVTIGHNGSLAGVSGNISVTNSNSSSRTSVDLDDRYNSGPHRYFKVTNDGVEWAGASVRVSGVKTVNILESYYTGATVNVTGVPYLASGGAVDIWGGYYGQSWYSVYGPLAGDPRVRFIPYYPA